jgi:hypothetical protein
LILFRALVFLLGLAVVIRTVISVIQTFVLPRSANDRLARFVFLTIRRIFDLRLRRARTYAEQDRILAFYAPISVLALLPFWLALVSIGYMGMYWATGRFSWLEAYRISGSSLLTLGFATATDEAVTFLEFTEATLGLMLVALLIAYLPSMYAAFQRREAAVTLLEVRAGSPPSAVEMISRYQRIHGLDQLSQVWKTWEAWFVDIEESHTSLAALVFFRSPQPEHSWVTAAGAVLDAASLTRSTVEIPTDPQADLCIRAGYLALRRIADFFRVEYDPDPRPDDPISISREEFMEACQQLVAQGVPLKPDQEQAWRDYAGWRVNYDRVLLALAALTMAPPAPWSSDRGRVEHQRRIRHKGG